MNALLKSSRFLSALLLAGAALFLVGIAAERSSGETHAAEHVEAHGEGAGESSEAGAQLVERGERVLGLDLESNGWVGVAVAASVVLAGLAWHRPRRPVLLAVAAFSAAFMVFDIAELAHQLDVSRVGFAALAGLVAAVHLAAAAVAAGLQRPR